jgi:hypothetical protein
MVDSSGGASRDTEIQYLSPMSGAASSGGALSASREKSKASTSTSGPNEQDRDKSSEIDSQQSPQLLVLEITVAGVTDDVIVHYGDQPR